MTARSFAALRLLVASVEFTASIPLGGDRRRERLALRVLAARNAVQSAVTWMLPRTDVVRAGSAVDALHAASMVAVAALSRRHRRAAIADAFVATTLATAPVWVDRSRR